MTRRLASSKMAEKRGSQTALRVRCKGVTHTAYQKVATRLRRLRKKRSWSKLNDFYPDLSRATLRKVVTNKTYRPKEPSILIALGLSPLPAVAHDVLAILYSGAPPVMRDGRRK